MNTTTEFDYLIVGAGPGGLQLGYFLGKSGRKYIILESGESAGRFFARMPRQPRLISINKRHTGYSDRQARLRYDWNSLLCDDPDMVFTRYSRRYFPDADDYVRYLTEFARRFQLNIKYGVRAAHITRTGAFVVQDQTGQRYAGRRLVMATGVSKPHIPDIPGIALAENYVDVSVDPDDLTVIP
jgi:cation diffusion facilitator CzcD-associated flavoprotein CzcO